MAEFQQEHSTELSQIALAIVTELGMAERIAGNLIRARFLTSTATATGSLKGIPAADADVSVIKDFLGKIAKQLINAQQL